MEWCGAYLRRFIGGNTLLTEKIVLDAAKILQRNSLKKKFMNNLSCPSNKKLLILLEIWNEKMGVLGAANV